MDPASDLVLALRTLTGYVGATNSLELFVLNTEEFVLRNEGEVFQHFVFFYDMRSLRRYIHIQNIIFRLYFK